MLDPRLQKLMDEQEKLGGLRYSQLPEGAKLVVGTTNSTYCMEVVDKNTCKVSGGWFAEHNRDGETVVFSGSTWGGSCIKLGWIGEFMQMEFWVDSRPITTSAVRSCRIETPNGKFFQLWT